MKEKLLTKLKEIFTKKVIITLICVLVLLFIGIISHLVSVEPEYPQFFFDYVSNNLDAVNKASSFNFSSLNIFHWMLLSANGDINLYIELCQKCFIFSLSILFIAIVYIIFVALRDKSIYSFILVAAAFTIFVFTTGNQFIFFDSILLPFSVATSVFAVTFILESHKRNNIILTSILLALVIAMAIIFGNILLMLLVLCVSSYIAYPIIRNKKINKNEVILLSLSILSVLIYLVIYVFIGKKLFGNNIETTNAGVISTFLKNMALVITGPQYEGNVIGNTIRTLIGLFLLLVNLGTLVFLSIKNKKISYNAASFVITVFVSFLYTILNKKCSEISEQPYFAISALMVLELIINVGLFVNSFSFYKNLKYDVRFLISNVFYSVFIVAGLFSYCYAIRYTSTAFKAVNLPKICCIIDNSNDTFDDQLLSYQSETLTLYEAETF